MDQGWVFGAWLRWTRYRPRLPPQKRSQTIIRSTTCCPHKSCLLAGRSYGMQAAVRASSSSRVRSACGLLHTPSQTTPPPSNAICLPRWSGARSRNLSPVKPRSCRANAHVTARAGHREASCRHRQRGMRHRHEQQTRPARCGRPASAKACRTNRPRRLAALRRCAACRSRGSGPTGSGASSTQVARAMTST
jgi:hypothetical protein